jgi:hypothetical protein
MENGYHATVKALLSPILPDGYAGFMKPHLGQCSTCARRIVTELQFGNGTRGEVHLCEVKRKELGIEDDRCATRRKCSSFAPNNN